MADPDPKPEPEEKPSDERPKEEPSGEESNGEPSDERPDGEPTGELLRVPTKLELRAELEELLRGELLGPAEGPEEEVDEPSIVDRYLVGMLAPKEAVVGDDQDDEFAEGGEDSVEEGKTERSGIRSGTLLPCSMGLSFVLDGSVDRVRVRGAWGRYTREQSEKKKRKDGTPPPVWKRYACGGEWLEVPITDGQIEARPLVDDDPEVVLRGISRRLGDQWIVTLFLVNEHLKPDTTPGTAWLFQAGLEVRGVDDVPVFERRPTRRSYAGEPELRREEEEMAMASRHFGEFAVGHGVAVHTDVDPGDAWKALCVRTEPIPRSEVERMDPPTPEDKGFEGLAGLQLDMKVLAEEADPATALEPLVLAYSTWIEEEAKKVADPEQKLSPHEKPAARVIKKAERARDRLLEGLELLRTEPKAVQAFQFANRAMWLQRIHTIHAEGQRRGLESDLEEIDANPLSHSWRPFQLAFVLLNLPSSTNLHHPERSHPTEAVADLLWFPTGGGKTEAYLGLAAYVMGLRRLEGTVEGYDGEHGVAVLMRYTLRLLTLQQFQRATALICACETIRRENPEIWGEAIFRIGIWVGGKTTPNYTQGADQWVEDERGGGGARFRGSVGGTGSPHQLTNCPWCGTKINPSKDIIVEPFETGRGRTLVYCGDRHCDFATRKAPKEGLPVLIVDEEIYRFPPTLLIATVDKFAQMPWNGRTQMLFGHVDSLCPRHGFRTADVEDADSHPRAGRMEAVTSVPYGPLRPPDLIIQDELHLISGPLGSMVGLYETAVDALCTWEVDGKKVRPKVVASTATIRNAVHQVRSLFMRQVEVFPPQGTSSGDNFFSLRRGSTKESPSRLYLGICAPGKKLKVALIRVYMGHLGAAQLLYKKYGKDADAWMTLVGYFNSIRELGGMKRLVEDDIANRTWKLDRHGLGKRNLKIIEELTSRMGATDIPAVLDHLEAVFDPALEAERKVALKARLKPTTMVPIDVLLSTNMISVGVDVQRLGCMVVAGQPKGTAEYIQATSRVGRAHPGVVTTAYNWSRPRDLSHFERFEHYHSTFYDQVEALSVTPFAARALDRGLAALLVTLIRLRSSEFNANDAPPRLQVGHDLIHQAVEDVRIRVANVLKNTQAGDEVKARSKSILDEWLDRANRTPTLVYRLVRGDAVALLQAPEEQTSWGTFTCLNSLRDVEPSPGLILQEDGTSQSEEGTT